MPSNVREEAFEKTFDRSQRGEVDGSQRIVRQASYRDRGEPASRDFTSSLVARGASRITHESLRPRYSLPFAMQMARCASITA